MIEPKNLEPGVWKVIGGKRQAPRMKPKVSMLLEKYTSCKDNNVSNRLGSVKRPRSPSGHGGHERWRRNSYDQQPYFFMQRAFWGCTPPVYPQFSSRGFYPWAPYTTGSASYFQSEMIPARSMFRAKYFEKRTRFNQEVRPRDPMIIHGNDERPILGISNSRKRHNTDGIVHRGGKKFMWVPVRRAEPQAVKNLDNLHPIPGLKAGQEHSADTAENSTEATYAEAVKDGSVHRKDAGTQDKGMGNTVVASSSTNMK